MRTAIKKFKFDYKKWLAMALTIFLSLVLVVIAVNIFINQKYEHKFYPGVKVAGVNLTGLTKEQAQKIFKAKINQLNKDGQLFIYQNRHVTVYPITIFTSDPDLTHEIISFQLDQTLDQAYNLGRSRDILANLRQKMKQIFRPKDLALDLTINEEEIKNVLINNFKDLEQLGHNPQLKFVTEKIEVTPEKIGLIFDYAASVEKMKINLSHLNFEPINLQLELDRPDFTRHEVSALIYQVRQIIDLSPITLYASTTDQILNQNKKSWLVNQAEIENWLDFAWDEKRQQPQLIFKLEALEKFFQPLKKAIEQPVKEARFARQGERVTEFQTSQVGQELDLKASLENLENKIIKQKKSQAEIVIREIKPQVSIENINDLGIKELIGLGHSNFSGSPPNRRHNIKVGAESLNGLLIRPSEEFSLNQALGEITASKGYLPELVIKGNKTLPEYGGGLCQIATTAFRLAINSGLPITERQPHAYRVVYYEPAGTDATIYPPHPDLRFKNDTPNYLLLQTRVEKEDLTFEFWGTADGRKVATTTPKIFNIVKPGSTKYIETTDLPPEKVKCLEIAHNGADTEFSRIITYPNGEKKEEVWQSHYRPWQAVCLIGVEPGKMATSTGEMMSQ